jgi:arylsulfatase A
LGEDSGTDFFMRLIMLPLFSLIFGLTVLSGADRSIGNKPNVILIMADDVSWEAFGCYGAEDYLTPRIDELASKGIRFKNCFSTPICTPSRVKIMTGKYNFRNYTHFGYLNPNEKTFGHMMQDAGYKTAIAGKWQLNGLYNNLPGHDDGTRPAKAGFDEYFLWQVTTGKTGDIGGERFWNAPIETNGKFITKEENAGEFGPDQMSDFLCDFMERNSEDPFFLYYPMVLVHDPFVPTPDSIGDASKATANKWDKTRSKEHFVSMVNYMDKIVGKIADKVEALGLSENTIIMFTADNGTGVSINSGWNGQNIKGGKGGPTDMGTHVPFVAYWKGQTPNGAALDDLVDFTDFYATLADAAGVTLGSSDPIDGRSFLPRLRSKAGNPRDWVFTHYRPYWNKVPVQFARTERFKLYRDGRFFEVPTDLKEANDLMEGSAGERGELVRERLQAFLDQTPPAPTESGDRNTEHRPIYPDWRNLVDPND